MASNNNTEKAYQYIYELILSGEKKQGEPISEMEIAGSLNISRSPVREALKLLEMQGLIVHFQNRGTFVAEISRKDVAEIFQLRILLELEALKTAAGIMDEAILDRLKADIENLNENSTAKEYYAANTALHEAIIRYGGNGRMEKFYKTLSMQIALVNRMSAKLPDHFRESRDEHLAIVAALTERDEKKAVRLLRNHLERVRDKTLVMIR